MVDESKAAAEVWTAERCFVAELLNDELVPDVSVARCRVKPGVTTQLHTLSVLEWYVIEAGHGLMRLGDAQPYRVGPGDTVRIPAGRQQQLTNTGRTDLLFFCVCVPRFTPSAYSSQE